MEEIIPFISYIICEYMTIIGVAIEKIAAAQTLQSTLIGCFL